MQINFTGIKNIGYEKSSIDYTRPDFPTEIKDYLGVDENMLETSWHWLNVELKDDYNGKHLSDYKKAMKNSGLNIDDFSNPINKNFLNISIADAIAEDEYGLVREDAFYINEKEVQLNDKTLPIFSYIAKLIREVSKKPDENFIVNKNYLESKDSDNAIVIGNDLSKYYEDKYTQEKFRIYNPPNIKDGAEEMDKIIMDNMSAYFNVNIDVTA